MQCRCGSWKLATFDTKRCQLSSVASLSHWASTLFACSTFAVTQRVARVCQRHLILVITLVNEILKKFDTSIIHYIWPSFATTTYGLAGSGAHAQKTTDVTLLNWLSLARYRIILWVFTRDAVNNFVISWKKSRSENLSSCSCECLRRRIAEK